MNTQSQPPAAGEAAHTPTPFSLHVAFDCRYTPAMQEIVIIGRGAGIAKILKSGYSGLDEANAAFIVRACNAYEANQAEISRLRAVNAELLGALKNLRAAFVQIERDCDSWKAYREARAAIQRAEEGRP